METEIEELFQLGFTKNEKGLSEESIVEFMKVLSLNPNHIAALYQISYALSRLNRHEEALIYSSKVIELHPDWDSYMGRAAIKKALGDIEGEEADRNKAWSIGKIACWG
jgi:tetratricopeptide (TPR) repeat protein